MGELSERRRFPRYPCKGAAELFQNGQRMEWGTVSDIGRCGCYIETLAPMPGGSDVELHLSIAGLALHISAKVACSTPMVGMGLEFQETSREQENLLAQILGKVTSLNPPPASAPLTSHQRPASPTIQITREAAPVIFAKMLKQINEKGVLTKEELVEMVKQQ